MELVKLQGDINGIECEKGLQYAISNVKKMKTISIFRIKFVVFKSIQGYMMLHRLIRDITYFLSEYGGKIWLMIYSE